MERLVSIDSLKIVPHDRRSLAALGMTWGVTEKQYYVYILSSKKHGTLYTGIAGNLVQRIWQHKEGLAEGFTKKYKVHHLVYYEIHSDCLRSNNQRKTHQEVEPTMENKPYRAKQPPVA